MNDSPDHLLSQLRALPVVDADDAFAEGLRREARRELVAPPAKAATPWRDLGGRIFGRVVIPLSLAGATVVYLMWAVDAATRAYGR